MRADRPPKLAWVPPLLLGAAAATAAEISVALLLYTGPGFLRSLTVLLAAAGLAFAGGLWSAPAPGPGLVDRLRRRWLLGLFAYLAAAAFSVAWSLPGLLDQDRLGQALGLIFLAALPLFASGSVLGGLSAVAASDLRAPRVGAPAALGAALGFGLTGWLLPRTPLPASLLIGCLVALSLGGMVFGAVLGTIEEVELREERASGPDPVRVEDRRIAAGGVARRVLLEGRHERASVDLDAAGALPWDVVVARSLAPADGAAFQVLAVGGGASRLARTLVAEHPGCRVDVLERSVDVVDLGREHLGTELRVGEHERICVAVGNLEDLMRAVHERYDAVLVDASALGPLGGARGLSREARGRLVQAVAATGRLVWGPSEPEEGMPELAVRWARARFTRDSVRGTREALVVMAPFGLDGLPASIEGFVSGNGGPALS